jgi:hypothetical protein
MICTSNFLNFTILLALIGQKDAAANVKEKVKRKVESLPYTETTFITPKPGEKSIIDGIREFSEDSIAGDTVTLETLEGEIVQETQTGIDGEYLFTDPLVYRS